MQKLGSTEGTIKDPVILVDIFEIDWYKGEELSGLSVSTISRIETGKYMPTIENLLKLSEILDVGLDYFLYDLLPHNKDIQSPAIQDAISIMNQMGERQTEYIVKILKIYQVSHQD